MRNIVKPNCFYDSIVLMQLGQELSRKFGTEITLMMGTEANKSLLKDRGLLSDEGKKAKANDLIICCDEQVDIESVLSAVENLSVVQTKKVDIVESSYEKSDRAANLVVISIPGEFVFHEVKNIIEKFEPLPDNELLNHKLCIFIFSDNVSLEEEVRLKKLGLEKNILIMGPDCGTAIVNGIGLGFANIVTTAREDEFGVGVISAGGSGLQAITCMINNYGVKLTEAIGVGGRDLSDEVGGITTIEGIKFFENDKRTKAVILFSKPPSERVSKKVIEFIKNNCKKKYVINFLGLRKYKDIDSKIIFVNNTNEAVERALEIAGFVCTKKAEGELKTNQNLDMWVKKVKQTGRKYIRALYSGGSLCEEAMVVLYKSGIKEVYSNVPLDKKYKINNPWQSFKHTFIDFGDDFFTRGKPHPMIDFTFRKERILNEAQQKDVAVIAFDLILGIGAHPKPLEEIKETIVKAKKICRSEIIFSCVLIGTERDPQGLYRIRKGLKKIGVLTFDTNVKLARFLSKVVS
ncbi:MAG: hypothetical protein NZ928_07400 [Endomicrobia bacterium]|nr:hypothetical protein [Endomicrobiia bacterium]MDW8056153.1 hypothetical protein [Elusimicrobiota bacterium]